MVYTAAAYCFTLIQKIYIFLKLENLSALRYVDMIGKFLK